MPSHFEAAKGVYIVRDYSPGKRQDGTFYVQGTSAMANIVKLLGTLDQKHLNIKIVYASSTDLCNRQPEEYKKLIVTNIDKANSTIITTQSRKLMKDWLFNSMSSRFAMSADWDNRWRTGGSLDEVIEESHLSSTWLLKGIEEFVSKRNERVNTLINELAGMH